MVDVNDNREVKYLLFRCYKCGRLITKYQMLDIWQEAELADADVKGLCPCGSGRISPGNATVWEELTRPDVWLVWWLDVALPWLKRKIYGA